MHDEARAAAVSFFDRIATKVKLIRNVLPVPSGASMKEIITNPTLKLRIILWQTSDLLQQDGFKLSVLLTFHIKQFANLSNWKLGV